MTKPFIHNYLRTLQQQIADVTAKIKQKQQLKSSSFAPEVYEFKIRTISSVEDQSYNLVDSEANFALLGQEMKADSGYVAESYETIGKVDKKTSVVEGLVFENNKEFDFKV